MVLIRRDRGGAGVGRYWWENDGDVVDVDDIPIAEELLRFPGFTDVTAIHQTDTKEAVDTPVVAQREENAGATGSDPAPDRPDVDFDSSWDREKILAWVGDSKERADRALRQEKRKGFAARKPLVADLTKIIEG